MQETWELVSAKGTADAIKSVTYKIVFQEGADEATHLGMWVLKQTLPASTAEDDVISAVKAEMPLSQIDDIRNYFNFIISQNAVERESDVFHYGTAPTEADKVRKERNALLVQTDWATAAKVETGSYPKGYQEYRQALREITTQDGFPDNVVWPTKPE